jgi:hypothetical protein
MAKNRKKTLARALGAGTASIAVTAAALVPAAPAFAAAAVPGAAPIGATVRITDASLSSISVPVIQLRADACSNFYTTPSINVINGEIVTKPAGDSVSFRVPTVPFGVNGVAKVYNVCVYPGTSTTTSGVVTAANASLTVYPSTTTTTPGNGPSGGGNTVTVTASTAVHTAATTVGALFTSNPCPATYITGGGNIMATATKQTATTAAASGTAVSIPVPSAVVGTSSAITPYNICLYAGVTGTDALVAASTYTVSLPQIVLSSSSGSHESTNGITISSGAVSLFGGFSVPGILFTAGTNCPAFWDPTGNMAISPTSVRRLASNRLAVTIPPLPLSNTQQPQAYQLCVYNGTTGQSTPLAVASYTSTILPNPIAISPAAGPATGGTTITVQGTDFPTAPGSIAATIGGIELTGITPLNSSSFTATLPAHSVEEEATLVVTTSAGTRSLPGAFAFRDAIKVSPNTAPNTTSALDISVQGAGFLSYPFGAESSAAKVYLVRGEYNGAQIDTGVRSNSPVAECGNVLVIGDNELVCTLRLDRRLNALADGFVGPATYTRSLTADITTIAGSRTITSTQKSFGPDDVGHPIVQGGGGTDIPANTTIKSVLSPGKAVISAPAVTTNAVPFDANIGGSVRTVTAGLIASAGSTTISLLPAVGLFTKADIGRVIHGTTGIPNGTTITSVAPNGVTATISAPAAPGTNVDLSISATTQGSTTISGTFSASDVGAVIGNNPLGIPSGTTILSQSGTAAVLSAAAGNTTTSATTVTVNRPSTLTLYPAAAVHEGAYNLTVVSNGAPDAPNTDPDYTQTAVTSGSTFTVGSF